MTKKQTKNIAKQPESNIDLNPVYEAAWEVQSFCLARQWQFCFIGGVAVQRWGEPRVTLDADLTLITGFGEELKFIEPLLAKFAPRRPNAAQFAQVNRVLLLAASNGIPIDIGLGAIPFEENTIERASRFKVGQDRFLITCSAEDLIVHKAFANRVNDWADIDRVLMRQRGKLNFDLVWRELRPLIELKEAPEIEDQLKKLIAKVDRIGR
jgi:hypothetical protein